MQILQLDSFRSVRAMRLARVVALVQLVHRRCRAVIHRALVRPYWTNVGGKGRAFMTGELRASRGWRRLAWRRSWTSSIRTRVLAIVLIPSAALLITGASVAGYLISEGLSARDFAGYFVQSSGTIVQVESAVEQERTISLRALGGDRQARAGLPAQWNTTNAALRQLITVANVAQGLNAQAVTSSSAGLHRLTGELPVVRQGVQTGRASISQVDAFYTQLADGGSPVFLQSALAAPGTAAAVDEVTVLDLYPVPDLQSHLVGLGAGWATHGVVTQPDRLVLAQLAGAYRNQLQALLPRLPPVSPRGLQSARGQGRVAAGHVR